MAEEQNVNEEVLIGDDKVTLAELAGISMDDIVEQRGGGLPAGLYIFEVALDSLPHLEAIEIKGIKKPVAKFPLTVLECIDLKNPAEVPEGLSSMIGKIHTETFFISAPIEKSLGYAKAFIADIGGAKVGKLEALFASCGGLRFMAPIGHRKDPNDSDKVYINIVRSKIKVMQAAAQSTVARQLAA